MNSTLVRDTIEVAPWLPAEPYILVIGQSAGRDEGRQGRPFVGPAGQAIRAWLQDVGFDPDEDVAWDNVDPFFHRDDPNHVPTAKESKEGYERLRQLIELLADQIKCVLLLGGPASHFMFKGNMGAMHGRETVLEVGDYHIPVIACYHPSWVIRTEDYKTEIERENQVREVLARVRQLVDHGPKPVVLPTPTITNFYISGRQAIDVETEGVKRVDTADPRRATFVCASAWPAGMVTFEKPRIDPDASLIVHNHPYDAVVLGEWDREWDDTKMLAHLGGEADTTLKGLKVRYLGEPAYHHDQAVEDGRLAEYNLGDSYDAWRLEPILRDKLEPSVRDLYDTVEKPLFPLWAKMTLEGSFRVDYENLRVFKRDTERDIEGHLERVHELLPRGRTLAVCIRCGLAADDKVKGQRCEGPPFTEVLETVTDYETGLEVPTKTREWKGANHKWTEMYDPDRIINIRSHDQLRDAINQLGIPVDDVQKGTLQVIQHQHPVIPHLLELSRLNKLLGTYIEPWLEIPEGQRFGCVWRPTGTGTGRVSSAYPNQQNVPYVMEKFLLPPEDGYEVLEFDNGQLEVRVAAHISQDPTLIKACLSEDFHGTMQEAFGVTNRRLAKVGVFGTMYLGGVGAFLASCQSYGVTEPPEDWRPKRRRQHISPFKLWAFEFQDMVRKKMPGYFEWANDQAGVRIQPGLFGRIHYIPPDEDHAMHRMAVNYPIQGGAGTITKKQMLDLHQAGYWVVRQVHDSVSVAVPKSDVEAARHDIPRIMENAVELSVPIKVEVK